MLIKSTTFLAADSLADSYVDEKDRDRVRDTKNDVKTAPREYIFAAGQSRRIWNELYKVCISFVHIKKF